MLDLKSGVVVRAKAGERSRYAPIVTPLAMTADPVDVARGLLGASGARRLYIADLDAIGRTGSNDGAVLRIAAAFPTVEIWFDAGIGTLDEAQARRGPSRCRPVVGSESQSDMALLTALGPDAILSLDFRGDAFMGPPRLLADAMLWPRSVIVMTLARVGMDAGPDFERLAAIRRASPAARVFAAGGVRGRDDLAALARLGIAGALVATALHEGRVGTAPI